MKVLVLGGSGLLGHKLAQTFSRRFETIATFRGSADGFRDLEVFKNVRFAENFDAENFERVRARIAAIGPDVIVNAIGVTKHVTAIDDARVVTAINSDLPHQLAEISASLGSRLILIGTDCVFNGSRGGYSEADEPNASDLYGRSKAAGEVTTGNCLTLRTSIIGRELFTAHSLIEWFLSNRGASVKGFSRAIYTGFPTLMMAEIIADIIERHHDIKGLYHLSSEPISKFELLRLVDRAFHADIDVEADDSILLDRSLDSSRFRAATGFAPEPWERMIERMAADPTPYDSFRPRK